MGIREEIQVSPSWDSQVNHLVCLHTAPLPTHTQIPVVGDPAHPTTQCHFCHFLKPPVAL
jgi:hypothetical protein